MIPGRKSRPFTMRDGTSPSAPPAPMSIGNPAPPRSRFPPPAPRRPLRRDVFRGNEKATANSPPPVSRDRSAQRIMRLCRVALRGDAGEEFDAGGYDVPLPFVAMDPYDSGGNHLPAVGQGLALAIEADVDGEQLAFDDRGVGG